MDRQTSLAVRITLYRKLSRRPFGAPHAAFLEAAVARLVAGGLTLKEAARQLGIAPSTVRSHMRTVYSKLGVAKQSEMAIAVRDLR